MQPQISALLWSLAVAVCSLQAAQGAGTIAVLGDAVQTYNGQWFQVSVSNESPDVGDVVGLFVYNGPYSNSSSLAAYLSSQTAIKFWFPAELDATYLTANKTKFSINLPNYRKDVFLALFKGASIGGTQGGFLLAELLINISQPITQANPNEVTQIHISILKLYSRRCTVALQWTTRDAGTRPAVQYFSPSRPYRGFKLGKSYTYTREQMCGPPASTTGWFNPGTLHRVLITVPLGSKITARVGDQSTLLSNKAQVVFFTPPKAGKQVNIIWTADYGNAPADKALQFGIKSASTNFYSPPSPGDAPDPTNVDFWLQQNFLLFTGQANAQGSSSATAEAIQKELPKRRYHAMFVSGDISYARGYQSQWDQFFLQNNLTFASVPLFVAMGNHERNFPIAGDRFRNYPSLDQDSGGECGVPTLKRFVQPPPWTAPYGPYDPVLPDTPWYSINLGPIHYVTYSSEHDVDPFSAQYKFIAHDLARVNRKKTPFVVVGGHRPMHVSSTDGVDPTSDLLVGEQTLQAFEDLFYIYEVDLVLHGHHHSYQRTKPVYKRNVTAGAPVYVVAGNAGYDLSLDFQPALPDYFEKIILKHGFLRLSATRTSLTCELLGTDGLILDSFTLTKPSKYKPQKAIRTAYVASLASASDQYETKLISNNSAQVSLQLFSQLVLPNINAQNLNQAVVKMQAQAPGELALLLTNNVDRPDSLERIIAADDFFLNYLIPIIQANNATVNNSAPFKAGLAVARGSLAFGKSLLGSP